MADKKTAAEIVAAAEHEVNAKVQTTLAHIFGK